MRGSAAAPSTNTSSALPARGGGSPAHHRPSAGGSSACRQPSRPSRRRWWATVTRSRPSPTTRSIRSNTGRPRYPKSHSSKAWRPGNGARTPATLLVPGPLRPGLDRLAQRPLARATDAQPPRRSWPREERAPRPLQRHAATGTNAAPTGQARLRRASARSSAPSSMLRTASAKPRPAAPDRVGGTPEGRADARSGGS
jgi:hypothetical protein